MNATIYHFSKDTRSTARPASSSGTSVSDIYFKDNTSREAPVLRLTTSSLNNDYTWNYIHILGAYYYINDIIFLNNEVLELHCSKDVLATYKTEIESSTQYVVRSTHSADLNGFINDTAYPMTNEVTTTKVNSSASNTWLGNYNTAILGVLGPNQGDTTTYYEMPVGRLTSLIQLLYSVDVAHELSITSIEVGLIKTLFDPIKYMTSCILLPYTKSAQGNVSEIKTGYISLPFPDEVIRQISSNEGRGFSASIPYANHPQAGTRGHYLNISPYTQRVLTVMPFGTFNLDCSKLNDYDHKIRLEVTLAKSDGNAMLEVYTIPDSDSGLRNTLLWANAQLGVHIPLYQSDSIFKQTFSLFDAQTKVVSDTLSANFAAIPGACMQWIGAVNTMHAPEVHQVGGASGSFISAVATGGIGSIDLPRLDSTFYNVVPIDNNLGVMVCKNKVLSTMSGFNICENAKIEIPGTSADAEAIKNYLNTGVIIP